MNTAINKCPVCGGQVYYQGKIPCDFYLNSDGKLKAFIQPLNQEEKEEEEKLRIVLGDVNIKTNFYCLDCGESLWGKLVKKNPLRFKLWPIYEDVE